MKGSWALLLLVVSGCGGGMAAPPVYTGAVTVAFAAQQPPAGPLTLDGAMLGLEDVALFGDVQAAPGIMLPDVAVDALAPGTPLTLAGLPQGVYSRLRFSVESLHVSGHWRAQTLLVDLFDRDDDDDVVADLRASDGRELTPGHTIGFVVAIDLAGWFAGLDLDQAIVDPDGCIRVGGGHNTTLVPALLAALPPSFALTAPIQ